MIYVSLGLNSNLLLHHHMCTLSSNSISMVENIFEYKNIKLEHEMIEIYFDKYSNFNGLIRD